MGFTSCEVLGNGAYPGGRFAQAFRQGLDFFLAMGQEFVQGRIQQADIDRQPVHHLEQLQHVVVLELQ